MTNEEQTPIQVQFICCVQTMPFDPIFDGEGFLICPEHHRRRYGWRSQRLRQYPAHPFDPDKPEYINRIDHRETVFEQDRAIVLELFGDIFESR